ncbi:MAG: hypothetical protein WKF84_30995 [Pyrinomonadaceae bacterium]
MIHMRFFAFIPVATPSELLSRYFEPLSKTAGNISPLYQLIFSIGRC